jgi:hypothetical protein
MALAISVENKGAGRLRSSHKTAAKASGVMTVSVRTNALADL